MTAHDDAVAAILSAVPPVPPAIRFGPVTDLFRVTAGISYFWALMVDFGSGGARCTAGQLVANMFDAMDSAGGAGTARTWAVGRTAVTASGAGNGVPLVVEFVPAP